MISKVSPLFAKMRSVILAIIALCLVGFLGATDFMFRHEIKRQAKKQLIADGLQPNVRGIIQAIKEKRLALFEKYDTAGIDFGGVVEETGMTPLQHAIIDEDNEAIDQLLVRSSYVSRTINKTSNEDGLNPLMRCLNKRDFALAERLIDEVDADINAEKTPGLPYLVEALNTDDREMFDFLIRKDVDPNKQGTQPHSALSIAASKDHLDMMTVLVEKGASIAAPGVSGKSLLVEAAVESEYDEMEFLLSKGADINAPSENVDVLSIGLDRKDSKMKNIAVANGVNLNRKGKTGLPIVVEAFEEREYPWLQTMLKAGQPVDSKTATGDTLFASAVNSADYRMVDFLIGNGAKVNDKTKAGLSPLQVAVNEGDTALVRTLVVNRAKIKPEPMFAAAYRNRDNPTMNLLLNAGVNPEIKLEGTKQRVIDVAVNEGAVDAVRILLDNGADLGDNLWGALLTGQDDLVEVILKNGGDPKQKGTSGETPLEYALNQERFNLLKPLLAAGSDPNPMYDQDESWLSRTIRTGNRDAAYGLLMAGAQVGEGRASDGHSLLGWSIGHNMFDVTKVLLTKGLDPNVQEPSPATDEFTATFNTSRTFRRALKYDSKVRPLMMAAVKKDHDLASALVKAGAKNLTTRKYLYPVAIAAWYSDVKMMQICYGRNPDYQPRKIIVDLSRQWVTFYENGQATYSSVCSSGKPGHATPTGKFAITQKNRHHVSTIYGSDMPYFMRLSCRDFGLHVGHCPGYPASAGCVRLPWSAARHYYNKCTLGDMVIIQY